MTRFGAILAYDGTAYQGFQRQLGPTPTIQAAVEDAIAAISGGSAGIVAAGRTDAGVHATGQAIAFDVEWNHEDRELQNAINSQLPLDIALQRVWRQKGFHPRYDALWRQYAYRIARVDVRQPLLNRHVWQLYGAPLDIMSMREAAAICTGEHDFAAFGTAPQQGSNNTVRQILASRWESQESEYGTSYMYRIRGTAFLYHMVRRLVGTMVQVGKGKLTVGDFEEILLSRDLERAKVLAPPNGLVLEAVKYPQQAATGAMMDEAPLEEKV
ncbi:MAG: tRNA pseudouridine(38-40) synthase TruA [Chloroflexi bacterium]|nr:tRNA pseudouridine(38-40) synthase TruA [Chloroflexota bacterium]